MGALAAVAIAVGAALLLAPRSSLDAEPLVPDPPGAPAMSAK